MPLDRRKAEAIIPGKIWNFQAFKCQFPHPWGLLRVKYSPQNDHSANKRNHSQYFYSKFGKPRKNLVHVKITTWVQLIEIKLLWVVSPTLWQTSDKFVSSPLSKWTQQLILDSHLQSWLYCDTTGFRMRLTLSKFNSVFLSVMNLTLYPVYTVKENREAKKKIF